MRLDNRTRRVLAQDEGELMIDLPEGMVAGLEEVDPVAWGRLEIGVGRSINLGRLDGDLAYEQIRYDCKVMTPCVATVEGFEEARDFEERICDAFVEKYIDETEDAILALDPAAD